MTRLTQNKIEEVWLGSRGIQDFAHRIAALAVQEVERGVDYYRLNAVMDERTRLKAELAEAQQKLVSTERARDSYRSDAERQAEFAERYFSEVATLTAQLAEVTKERDARTFELECANDDLSRVRADRTALRAQLATAKRDKGEIAWQAFHSGAGWAAENRGATWDDIAKEVYRRYPPAIDPVTPATLTCEQDCPRPAVCKPGEGCHAPIGWFCLRCAALDAGSCPDCATPSAEAREVPSEVVVRVEDAYATEYSSPVVRITPADAKRIGILGGWRDAE